MKPIKLEPCERSIAILQAAVELRSSHGLGFALAFLEDQGVDFTIATALLLGDAHRGTVETAESKVTVRDLPALN